MSLLGRRTTPPCWNCRSASAARARCDLRGLGVVERSPMYRRIDLVGSIS